MKINLVNIIGLLMSTAMMFSPDEASRYIGATGILYFLLSYKD